MRFLLAFAAFLGTLAVVAPAAFFVVMFLAGPHSDLLPSAVQPLVLVLGWLCVLALPAWAARAVWRRGR